MPGIGPAPGLSVPGTERLEGHPAPVLPWVDVATGSLGQGLPDRVS
jgi:transketolase